MYMYEKYLSHSIAQNLLLPPIFILCKLQLALLCQQPTFRMGMPSRLDQLYLRQPPLQLGETLFKNIIAKTEKVPRVNAFLVLQQLEVVPTL